MVTSARGNTRGPPASPLSRPCRIVSGRDSRIRGLVGPPSRRLADIRQETILLTRSTSDPYMRALPVEFFAAAADAVAAALPHVTRPHARRTSPRVDAAALATPVRAFLAPPRPQAPP